MYLYKKKSEKAIKQVSVNIVTAVLTKYYGFWWGQGTSQNPYTCRYCPTGSPHQNVTSNDILEYE